MIELGVLVMLGLIGFVVLFAVGRIAKTILWIALLPVRLIFWLPVGGILILPCFSSSSFSGA